MTETTYTTAGPVRGNCGHLHDSLGAALACLMRDEIACRSQGCGCSDRSILAFADDELRKLTDDEQDEIDRLSLLT